MSWASLSGIAPIRWLRSRFNFLSLVRRASLRGYTAGEIIVSEVELLQAGEISQLVGYPSRQAIMPEP